jgi:hypothetical protein
MLGLAYVGTQSLNLLFGSIVVYGDDFANFWCVTLRCDDGYKVRLQCLAQYQIWWQKSCQFDVKIGVDSGGIAKVATNSDTD